ncbi:mitochondrial ribosomal small subunit component [Sporothrix stenoceras]|uniref:Small ribosomal subunit protein mS23 n=1 Tax=Sporothrix stenoceras TaxID=5173 RepID=A0ABR3ZEW3_9PEZI
MGRHARQFRALKVAATTRSNLQNLVVPRLKKTEPVWLKVVEAIPPAEAAIRAVPPRLEAPLPGMRKPRRTYMPHKILYEEDELRQTFFKDHPWELARPRVLIETDGKDALRFDWSKGLVQPGFPLSGESVVQRQMWLMHAGGMTKEQAYDSARREFYALRHKEDVERRVAQEEARMVGAYFGVTAIQANMREEDKAYEWWKEWAARQSAKMDALAASRSNIGFGAPAEEAPAQDGLPMAE